MSGNQFAFSKLSKGSRMCVWRSLGPFLALEVLKIGWRMELDELQIMFPVGQRGLEQLRVLSVQLIDSFDDEAMAFLTAGGCGASLEHLSLSSSCALPFRLGPRLLCMPSEGQRIAPRILIGRWKWGISELPGVTDASLMALVGAGCGPRLKLLCLEGKGPSPLSLSLPLS